MKKIVLIFALLASTTGLLSCQAEISQGFELTLKNDRFILINSTARSCSLQIGDPGFDEQDDLASLYATVGQFTVKWSGKNDLALQYIQITFEGSAFSGGKFALPAIASEKLTYAFNAGSGQATVAANTTQESTNLCTFVVGGIQLVDKTKSAYGQGTFLVYGTTTDDDGQTSAVFASVPFSYEYNAP